jgi:hypothetical protein
MPASTTPGGFPYPLPADPLSDLPSVARSLAERIDANTVAKTGDTMTGQLTVNNRLTVGPGEGTNGAGIVYINADAGKDAALILQRAGEGYFGHIATIGTNLLIRVWRNNSSAFVNALAIDRETGKVSTAAGDPVAATGLATKSYVDAASFHYDLVDTAITGEIATPLAVNTPAQGIESATWGGVTAAGGAVTLPKGLWSVCIRFALSWANDGYTMSTPAIIYSTGGQAVQPVVEVLAGGRVLCGLRQGGADTWYDEVHPSSAVTHVAGRFSGHMLRHIA